MATMGEAARGFCFALVLLCRYFQFHALNFSISTTLLHTAVHSKWQLPTATVFSSPCLLSKRYNCTQKRCERSVCSLAAVCAGALRRQEVQSCDWLRLQKAVFRFRSRLAPRVRHLAHVARRQTAVFTTPAIPRFFANMSLHEGRP